MPASSGPWRCNQIHAVDMSAGVALLRSYQTTKQAGKTRCTQQLTKNMSLYLQPRSSKPSATPKKYPIHFGRLAVPRELLAARDLQQKGFR